MIRIINIIIKKKEEKDVRNIKYSSEKKGKVIINVNNNNNNKNQINSYHNKKKITYINILIDKVRK